MLEKLQEKMEAEKVTKAMLEKLRNKKKK